MKAVFLDYATLGPGLDLGSLEAVTPDLDVYDVTRDDEVEERIRNADIVFTNKIRLTPELIASAPNLKLIALTATGTDNIDLKAAAEHGIGVANIRAYCTESVSEHVFGALLLLTHSLAMYDRSVKAGEWQRATGPLMLTHPVHELSGLTLGIVGFGELGRGTARLGAAFGMHVIVSARPGSGEVPHDRHGFDAVVADADVISLHCPLTDETRNLFGADEFRRMKSSAILVNTARGGLVDSAALAAALKAGEIAGAAIDVLPEEPPVNGDPLLDYAGDNLILTPHIAWGAAGARQRAIDELAANTRAFLDGERRNRVV